MPHIQIDQRTLYYDSHGTGHPLVLIAGLANTRLMWWKQVAAFSRHYHVVALDNRGMGDSSPAQAPFTIADMADDAAALIESLRQGPAHVVGISMGGFIAGTLCVRHPQLVGKLVLTSTSAGGPTHTAPAKEIIQLLLADRISDPVQYIRRVYSAIAGPQYMQNHPQDLEEIVSNSLSKPLSMETYLYQFSAVNQYTTTAGIDGILDRLTVPALVVHGDQDPLVPYPNGQYLAAHIPHAQLLTYAGVGHLPPIEATERYNRDVVTFLG